MGKDEARKVVSRLDKEEKGEVKVSICKSGEWREKEQEDERIGRSRAHESKERGRHVEGEQKCV